MTAPFYARTMSSLVAAAFMAGCAAPNMKGVERASNDEVRAEQARQHRAVESLRGQAQVVAGPPSYSSNFRPIDRLNLIANRLLIAAARMGKCSRSQMAKYEVTAGILDRSNPVVMADVGPVRAGDRLIGVDDYGVLPYKGADDLQKYYLVKAKQGGGPINYLLSRNGQRYTATLAAQPGCGYTTKLEDHNVFNAYANGTTIAAEKKLIVALPNDDDLAFVISHELTHNLKGHSQSKMANATVGMVGGAVVGGIIGSITKTAPSGIFSQMGSNYGAMAYSQDFERQADRGGMEILAAAGYSLEAGVRVARFMGMQNPDMIEYAKTHPSTGERAANLEKTAAALRAGTRPAP